MSKLYLVALLLVGFVFRPASSVGQQEWAFTQYLFNLYDINSAYAGNHEAPSFAMRYRRQWEGFNNSPQTQTFSVHSPIYSSSLAGGLKILHESIGARDRLEVKTSIAYHLRVSKGKISFAATGGVLRQQMNVLELSVQDPTDILLQNGIWISTVPVFDASVMFVSDKFFLGVESNHLNRQRLQWAESSTSRLFYQVTAVCGWMKKTSENDLLQLSALAHYSEGDIYMVEGDVAFLLNNLLWFGAGYRSGFGVVGFAEWNITRKIRFGYSFDLATNGLKNYQSGSHEIFLGFTPQKKSDSSIRYFE